MGNWTIATLVIFSAVILESVAVGISLRGYLKYRYQPFLFMLMTWSFTLIGNLTVGFAYLFLDFTIYRIGIWLTVPLAYSIIILFDSISHEHYDMYKFLVITILATALFIFGLDPDATYLNTTSLGEHTPAMQGMFQLFGSLVFLFSGSFSERVFWLYRVY